MLHGVCFCLSVSVSYPHPSFVPLTFHLSRPSSPTVLTRPPQRCSTPSLTLRFRLAKARNPVQPAAGMSCLSCCVCTYVCVSVWSWWGWCCFLILMCSIVWEPSCFLPLLSPNASEKLRVKQRNGKKIGWDGEGKGKRWDTVKNSSWRCTEKKRMEQEVMEGCSWRGREVKRKARASIELFL